MGETSSPREGGRAGNTRKLAFRHNHSLFRCALMLGYTVRHRRDYSGLLVVSGERIEMEGPDLQISLRGMAGQEELKQLLYGACQLSHFKIEWHLRSQITRSGFVTVMRTKGSRYLFSTSPAEEALFLGGFKSSITKSRPSKIQEFLAA